MRAFLFVFAFLMATTLIIGCSGPAKDPPKPEDAGEVKKKKLPTPE
jgi:hypothetical protein